MKTTGHRLLEHYNEATNYFWDHQIFVLALQGSQNYGLDTEDSDIDTKLLTLPSFESLAMVKKPISTTHIMENQEHIDFKDIRLYFQTFRKQNLNFLEILFTPWYIVNETYEKEWNDLRAAAEEIARMNPYKCVMSMCGLAETKYKNLKHNSPAADPFIEKYGYVPKELHHLLRIAEFTERYIDGEPFGYCMHSNHRDYLIDVKKGLLPLSEAEKTAEIHIDYVRRMREDFCSKTENKENLEVSVFLDDLQYKIMKKAMLKEMKYWE